MAPYSSMLDDAPQEGRPIEELITLEFSELTRDELLAVRTYHMQKGTPATKPSDNFLDERPTQDALNKMREEFHIPDETVPVDMDFLRDAGMTVIDFSEGVVDAAAQKIDREILDFTGDVDGGGYKNSMDDNYVEKPPMELVPQALTRGAARVLGYGAVKYAPNNWRRGMRWGEVFGALQRHLTAWNEGENLDPESGLSHLDHAAACLGFLMHMESHEAYAEMDDRP